jgi:hypothetical protein
MFIFKNLLEGVNLGPPVAFGCEEDEVVIADFINGVGKCIIISYSISRWQREFHTCNCVFAFINCCVLEIPSLQNLIGQKHPLADEKLSVDE